MSTEIRREPYVLLGELAVSMGWTRSQAQQWAVESGVSRCVNSVVVIPVADLSARHPDVWARVERSIPARVLGLSRRQSSPSVPTCRNEGRVYFAQQGSDGPIKIGHTSQVRLRLRSLQTNSPLPMVLLATVSGSKSTERAYHDRFKGLRIRGEWFRPGEELIAHIATLKIERAA